MPARGSCIAGRGPQIDAKMGHQHQKTLRAGERRRWREGGQRDVGGRRQGSRLGKSALLLLDRNSSANPKVAEGRFVGN